jgi:nucleotide-binding universal stress UspA family protein
MFRNIVVPIDGSECARRAFDIALDLARSQGARLAICSVVDPIVISGAAPPSPAMDLVLTDVENEARRHVAEALARARKEGVAAQGEMLVGVAFDRILEYAKAHSADLIVMGTHGRTGLPRFFIGSVAEMVLRKSPCPVLIAREDAAG